MIEVTVAEFIKNPGHIQSLAQKEPVIVGEGENKQILMDYDEYLSINSPTPHQGAYDAYMKIMADFPKEKLDALADDKVEFDMSLSENS